MKPNCMICRRFLTIECPLYHPIVDFKQNFPTFMDSLAEIIKCSAIVCDLYRKTEDEKGDGK